MIVVGVVYGYILASVLAREGLVGNLLRERHGHLGAAFSITVHREPMTGFALIKSSTNRKYPAFVSQV